MTGGGSHPSILGEAIRRAFSSAEEGAARHREAVIERAALDEVELRELEHSQFYGTAPTSNAPARKRNVIARLLRR